MWCEFPGSLNLKFLERCEFPGDLTLTLGLTLRFDLELDRYFIGWLRRKLYTTQAIKNQVQKFDKDVLITSRYDHLLSKAITNLEQDSKLDENILSKTSTRRLKQFCADVSGGIFTNILKRIYFICSVYLSVQRINLRVW